MNTKPNNTIQFDSLIENIRTLILDARKNVANNINTELLHTYWQIGKLIVEKEASADFNLISTRQLILDLSKHLTKELGAGFSRANLFNMRKFNIEYPDVQTLSGQLSWSHYCELLIIDAKPKRDFYQKEVENIGWSVRELKRQIDSSLYERIMLSKGKPDKETVTALALEGQKLAKPDDIVKDPYVFEFLGIPEKKWIPEKDLEKRLIRHLEEFLLELGKGFMFVGSQQRITINNTHYFVDMVFYNKLLKSYILIELKTRKLKIADAGQLNTYLNYFKTEVNDQNDNPPVGIIICADKDEIAAEYILSGFENSVFASRFTFVLPDRDDLIKELEMAMNEK